MGVTLEQAAADPERYQICKNGAIRDRQLSRFVSGAAVTTKFDSGSAMLARERRRELWEQRFQAGMGEAAAAEDKQRGGTAEDAIRLVGKNITQIAMSNDGMPAVKAAAEVARLGGWVEQGSRHSQGNTFNTINVVGDGSALYDLVRVIRSTVDAED